ncbi:glycosyltransferase family 2 protein [Candidatus Nitronereus thalassa]|uniref:Glycosyltransferase family 2 protein n=1 Tax=Candidatus Nitronereus thalassa TaxID=3020898 RepID=A0ABU3K540_9BACT|nr:glycosyltransferase family 2 protein [Candidatus Nitronereus thalassa]MDT7041524.1 glycosyltransferase family 2 protein [Candidatus Nitronereus thalassa]
MGTTLKCEQDMLGSPLVSVVCNFLNGEEFLQEAIESVICQTYSHWELLLVDDGSTDASTALAMGYVTRFPGKIRYLEHLNHQNRGASASRNLGMRESKGQYVAFLDADDVWVPQKLAEQVAIFQSHPGVNFVYGPGQWWYSWDHQSQIPQSDVIQDLHCSLNSIIPSPQLLPLYLHHNGAAVPPPSGILVDRGILQQVGGFEESFRSIYDDQVLYAKLGLHVTAFVSGKCWFRYRQHDKQRCSLTVQSGEHHAVRREYLLWLERYLKRCNVLDKEVWVVFHQEFQRYQYWHIKLVRRRTIQLKNVIIGIGKDLAQRVLPSPVYHWLQASHRRVK